MKENRARYVSSWPDYTPWWCPQKIPRPPSSGLPQPIHLESPLLLWWASKFIWWGVRLASGTDGKTVAISQVWASRNKFPCSGSARDQGQDFEGDLWRGWAFSHFILNLKVITGGDHTVYFCLQLVHPISWDTSSVTPSRNELSCFSFQFWVLWKFSSCFNVVTE